MEQEAEKQTKLLETLVEQQKEAIKLMKESVPLKKGDNGPARTAAPLINEGLALLPKETRIRRLKLCRAVLNGDWDGAKRIYDDCGESVGVDIADDGDTALHIAAAAKQTDFVKELVKIMNKNDLEKQNKGGVTALYIAAMSGKVELAHEMMKKNDHIAMIPDEDSILPIHIAAMIGHKEMVDYLYQKTRHLLEEDGRAKLFVSCIETSLYDVASQLLTDYPDLATAVNENGQTALDILARKNLTFSKLANQNQQGIITKCFNLGVEVGQIEKQKALHLVERIWKIVISSSKDEISKLKQNLIFDAAKRGNVEFLYILSREYPNILWRRDGTKNNYLIFHFAVRNRHMDIFMLIYEIGSLINFISAIQDKEDNNILHLAGMLAPPDRLNIVSGPALQMQRELLWFKEVEKFVRPRHAEARNKNGFTPRALFTKEHEGLREKGEKWMKDTATSCMVVAALIVTVAFAAAFMVPGGNNQDSGFPMFLEKTSLKIFAIVDAISLVSSAASISTFLSILTSRYTEEDFLWVLPRKLRSGLVTLFVSMVAMMVVFSTGYFVFFNNGNLWIAILVTVIASTPVIMFVWQHFQLFYDVLRFTHNPDSLFKRGKSFFRREGEASDQSQKKQAMERQIEISISM